MWLSDCIYRYYIPMTKYINIYNIESYWGWVSFQTNKKVIMNNTKRKVTWVFLFLKKERVTWRWLEEPCLLWRLVSIVSVLRQLHMSSYRWSNVINVHTLFNQCTFSMKNTMVSNGEMYVVDVSSIFFYL